MKIAAIIPTLEKNFDYVKLCVESLRDTVDWDIVVALNGTKDVLSQKYHSEIRGITNLLTYKQQGQCHAVNQAVKSLPSDTDWLFISNDDMYYPPNWNKNLRFQHEVFSPNLVEPVNNAGSAPPFLKVDGGYTLDEFNQEAVDKFFEENIDKEKDDPQETGFNFPVFIRKDVWDTIGGYDTTYDPWGSNSDTDLQTKIELAGIKPYRLRDVMVYHFSNKSGTFDGTHQKEWQDNFDYYTAKWGFNRDMMPTDVWYSKHLVDMNKLIYHPEWKEKYGKYNP